MTKVNSKGASPLFTRKDVALILNCTPLTIANRESNDKYPVPKRDMNNYRVYSIDDIMELQLITFDEIDPRPILYVLYDKGYRDYNNLGRMIDEALSKKKGIK